MKLRAVIPAFALLAAAAGAEERTDAPLEGSKQELKTLRADQAAKSNDGTAGRLTDALPQMQTPVPGAPAMEMIAPESLERELKQRKDPQKNWLLDAVGKLEKEAKSNGHGKEGTRQSAKNDGQDPADNSNPDYLLKIYDQQDRAAGTARADAAPAKTMRTDPLAPFLQGWLADSPVRGKFFDDFVKRSGPGQNGTTLGGADGSPNGASLLGFSQETDGTSRVSPAPVQSNPYLQVPDFPSGQDLGTAGHSPVPAAGSTGAAPVAAGVADPISVNRPLEKKPAFLAPTDDQKYFPQQKKF